MLVVKHLRDHFHYIEIAGTFIKHNNRDEQILTHMTKATRLQRNLMVPYNEES